MLAGIMSEELDAYRNDELEWAVGVCARSLPGYGVVVSIGNRVSVQGAGKRQQMLNFTSGEKILCTHN